MRRRQFSFVLDRLNWPHALCFVRTIGCTINTAPPSIKVFLNHAQMDPESMHIDFEWACNLERPDSRFNFGDLCLILDQSGSICALSEFAF
jgi:hypothetical protein